LAVVDAHTDDIPSYRLDNAFPALRKHALELNFNALDVTDHGHIPYFVILVRALDDWKQTVRHGATHPHEMREC
jgi:NEDD8-activating enzyme E1 regulatory subunit